MDVNRSIWAWLRLMGGAGILALVMWRLGTGAFLDGLRVLDAGALLAALGIGAATTLLSAWRWCLVARGLGMRLTLKDATADYYQALFLNAALPGGILGDVGRAVRHGKGEGDLGRGVRAVVLERTAGQIVLLLVGVAVLVSVPSPVFDLLSAHGPQTAAVAGGIAVAGVLIVLGLRRLRAGRSKAAGAARTGMSEIRAGLLSRRNGPGVLVASAAVLAGHLATFMVAARAAGSAATLVELAPLLLLALIAMGLPVNIGGWGPREGVMAWAFGAAGLSAAQGLTIAVAYGILAFVAAAPGAAVLVARLLARRVEQAAPQQGPTPSQPTPALPVPSTATHRPAVQRPAPAMAAVPVVVPLPVTRTIPALVRVGARQPAYSGGVAA
ncbi:lysylphosphatidylglycerol synthase transmembrane domain-containing protein [Actinoplanes sp. CA-252034]|uniref:lysylphosphatidylglycerol synthase transmembrane domain-containing protein n=1 Tax=Actinoplanes sp. CA-252034 TaxID=3239906 RepID=UPI003D966662